MIKIVILKQAEMAITLEPKGTGDGKNDYVVHSRDLTYLPVESRDLTQCTSWHGTREPRIAPLTRTAGREACLRQCGIGRSEEAKAML